jgi:Motility related/secretion protein
VAWLPFLLLGTAVAAQNGAPGDSVAADTTDTGAAGGQQAPPGLSDLAVRFGARGEFGGDWTRFRPCDASLQLTCEPGLIPQLQPQVQFSLESKGSIANRLFVDVDYDQTREFSGANRFQVYYQGQPGELLQRFEVGDVTFALPPTRFITRGIPVGNFGVLARAEIGGAEVQTVFAQQQGQRRTREFRLGGLGTDAGVIYRDTLVLDDADYVQGQFFFLVDPREISGYPHLDVLALRPTDAPASVAPGTAPIQLYRMERDPVRRQQVEGYIRADAVLDRDGATVRESGWFRYLRPGEDYYTHSSGLWIALRTPLRPGEALGVAYVSQNGQVVGDYNPEVVQNKGGTPTLHLIRATAAQHQPDRPTWDQEMKQVYRVSGSDDVDEYSLDVTISLGEESGGRVFREVPGGEPLSFLRLFGLDSQSPGERVDRAAIFQGEEELGDDPGPGIQGTFLVFPTLRPFLEPPPVPSEGLSAEETAALLGGDVNRRIYEALDPLERSTGGLYRLNMSAEVRSSGVASVFSLGAFGMREGSERIFLGERLLQPFIDYIIDPRVGIVTLLQPEALLSRSTSDVLRVSWEEPGLFQVAPTSVLGLSAHLPVSTWGGVDLIGLYQLQRQVVSRPRFGAEPPAMGMLGIRSEMSRDLPGLDAALSSLLGPRGGAGSRAALEGEIAVALPDPNRSGDAYLDDFDAGNERTVSLLSNAWLLGSAPSYRDGAEDRLPPVLDEMSAAPLVWQHTWITRSVAGDSVGIFDGFLPQEIDRQINVAGTQTSEPGLRLTFGNVSEPATPGARWRSFTTLLSPTGTDLTYTEFLDFYVAGGDSLTLVLDLGTVSEDAYFIDSAGRTTGTQKGSGRMWGLGLLDQEADPLKGEIWDPIADGRGVWDESCLADPGRVYDLADPNADCTRGNGRRDTEDLNGNEVLDTAERTVRYVVRLDGSSPYLARDRAATGTGFRLYRIPLRGPQAITPDGQFTAADWRAVQFLRLTVAGPQPSTLTLARMRLVGSRWVKRGVEGVLQGLGGDTLAVGGDLEVTPVSVLTEGSAYQAPPGVLGNLDDPGAAVSGRGVEFNEKSLGLRFRSLGPGDRVEVYNRFLQRPRSFLSYGEMRLWVVARSGSWSATDPAEFFVKVGTDAENFYLYRSPVDPVSNAGAVQTQDWLPERLIRFSEWMSLREEAERELLRVERDPDAPPVTVWSADSTYAVVLKDRARAPNLAAVREISIGVMNSGDFPVDGEIWVNELRLGAGIRTPGTAQYLNMEIDGGDVFQARLDYSGQGPRFQELSEAPTYQSDNDVALSGTVQLGALVPSQWGWDLPLSVSRRWSGRDPLFLEGTDLRTRHLEGVRTSGFNETRVSLSFRPSGSTGSGIVDATLSGLDARLSFTRSSGSSLTTESRTTVATGVVGYSWRPRPRTVSLVPDFLEPLVRILLPGAFAQRLLDTRVRWSPEELGVRSGLTRRTLDVDRFEEILNGSPPAGTGSAPESWLDSSARLALRPFRGLGLSLDMTTRRDLLDPLQGVRDPRVRPAVEAEREKFLGRDVGWETLREIVGRVTFQPRLPDWMRANLGIQTRYVGERDPGLVAFATDGDSTAVLLRNSGARRDMSGSVTVDPRTLLDGLLGPQPEDRDRAWRWIGTLGGAVSPMTLSVQDGVTSRFDREPVDPGAGFQLGWGRSGSFEELDDVRATTLVNRHGLSSGSGLRLPGTFFLNVNYLEDRVRAVDRRSDRNAYSSTWPDIRIGASSLPLPEAWRSRLPELSVNIGIQENRQDISFGGGTFQRRIRVDRAIPIEVAAGWRSGLVARYRGRIGRGKGDDPTGVTQRDLFEHGFSLETRLAPRGGLAERIQEPLRLSILVEYDGNTECRIVTGQLACVDFIDQVNRAASFTLDGRISGAEVGVQMSIVDRRSFTDIQNGYTQFQLGIWGRMVFESGPIERLQQRSEPF